MTDSKLAQEVKGGWAYRLLNRIIDVRPAEMRALLWSWLYIFAVLSSYYILRPIRDEMGVAGGVENLQWLFTGTLLGMIAVNPPLRRWLPSCRVPDYRGGVSVFYNQPAALRVTAILSDN